MVQFVAYEYRKRRDDGQGRRNAFSELQAAVSDLRELWGETKSNGITGIERKNLVDALDVVRTTLRQRSVHLPQSTRSGALPAAVAIRRQLTSLTRRPTATVVADVDEALDDLASLCEKD